MIDQAELQAVRRQWQALERGFDRRPALRYRLGPQGWRETLRYRLADALATIGWRRGFVPQGGWPVALKHAECAEEGPAVVIWAIGSPREAIRKACDDIARLAGQPARFSPVLLTDVADFAYYARLGWLVEYLPTWAGQAANHRERKLAYLAWRYRNALVAPLSAAAATPKEWNDLLSEASR